MKNLLLLLYFTPLMMFSQNEVKGEIVSKVSFGEFYYYYVKEKNNDNFYKTNAALNTDLFYGQEMNINLIPRLDGFIEIREPNTRELFLSKSISLNSNEDSSLNKIGENLLLKLPDVENEMLYFLNWGHYNEVVNLIENYVDGQKEINGSDFGLTIVENSFKDYTSFRKHYNTVFDSEQNSYTSEDVDKVEKKDFINNEIVKLLVNKNRLIQVGDSVYYYFDTDIIFSFEANYFLLDANETLLNIIDNVNLAWEDLNNREIEFPITLLSNKNSKLLSKEILVSNTKAEFQFDNQSPVYMTYLSRYNNFCQPFLKTIKISTTRKTVSTPGFTDGNGVVHATVYGPEVFDDLGNQNAVLLINWGDGTPIQVVNNYIGSTIDHTYSNIGDFIVNTKLTYLTNEGDLINMHDNVSVKVSDLLCSDLDDEEYGSTQTGNSNGDWKLAANVWAHDNVFSHEVGAYTHGWKKVNGSWRRKISTIYVEVNGVFRDTNCEGSETKYEDDQENQERVDAEKFKLFKRYWAHANGDVHSKHRLKKGSVVLELELDIIFCD